MMFLSSCSDSVSPTLTASSMPQLAQPAFRQVSPTIIPTATLTPSPTLTPTLTPTPTATLTPTRFNGLIPTQSSSLSVRNTVVVSTATVGQGVEYTVASGDTLTVIAGRYGVTVEDLLTNNGLTQSQLITPNQVLMIPIPTMTPSPAPTLDLSRQGARASTIILTSQAMLPPTQVNELPYGDFINLSDDGVQQRVQAIFARGQLIGRDPQAFTRIGDSTIEPPHFFYRFDEEDYDLGEYAYLQETIDYYAGSFGHDSVAVIRGLHTWSVFDPMWSPEDCDAGESMLACEFRLHNPSVIIIRLGTNDRAQADSTRDSYEAIVRYAIEQGVIPILGTKADRFDGEENSVNTIIREIADKYQVPLWDFDLVASTLPTHGLTDDNVHLTIFYAHDWRETRGFTTGHGLHNLTGLIVLDELLHLLQMG